MRFEAAQSGYLLDWVSNQSPVTVSKRLLRAKPIRFSNSTRFFGSDRLLTSAIGKLSIFTSLRRQNMIKRAKRLFDKSSTIWKCGHCCIFCWATFCEYGLLRRPQSTSNRRPINLKSLASHSESYLVHAGIANTRSVHFVLRWQAPEMNKSQKLMKMKVLGEGWDRSHVVL